MSAKTMADLKKMVAELREQQELQRQREQEKQHRSKTLKLQGDLFRSAVGDVVPLAKLAFIPPAKANAATLSIPKQSLLDEQRAWQESVSDDFDVTSLLETDEQLSYRMPSLSLDILQKLRKGVWSIQASLDLHGLRLDQAREAVLKFIHLQHRSGHRCVRIIHGKGHGSPGRMPVLKIRVQRWLVQKKEVLAFVQARACDGGAGALIVMLDRAIKKSSK